MNIKITEEQKHQLIQAVLTAVITLVLAIVSILGYNVAVPVPSGQINAESLQVLKLQGPVRFMQAVTMDSTLAVTGASTFTGAETHTGLMSVGSIVATGNITVGGTYVGITPVATATGIAGGYTFTGNVNGVPTLQAGGVRADTGVFTTSVSVSGTPVVAYSTPHTVLNGSANGFIRCNFNVITGTVTATPVAGATVIGYPWSSLGAVSGDSARVYSSYTAGTFTIGVMNSALTPAANATPADVEWCYYYVK